MTFVPPPAAPVPPPPSMPAGWYPDASIGMNRYWDGAQWTQHTAPFPPQAYAQPTQYAPQPASRQAIDRSQYVRQQRGHSIIAHVLFGWIFLYIPTVYYAISPNHYFHA